MARTDEKRNANKVLVGRTDHLTNQVVKRIILEQIRNKYDWMPWIG